jgi:hypothetical protein
MAFHINLLHRKAAIRAENMSCAATRFLSPDAVPGQFDNSCLPLQQRGLKMCIYPKSPALASSFTQGTVVTDMLSISRSDPQSGDRSVLMRFELAGYGPKSSHLADTIQSVRRRSS